MTMLARVALALGFSFVLSPPASAAGIIDHVPAEAVGFAVVHNLSSVDAKVQRLMAIFEDLSEVKPPAPLAFIRTATGLGAGVNESGDALMALLPGDTPEQPKPLLVVAVSDYAAFAASVGGDASGEISRVRIAGQEVLAAKRAEYAVLMNMEHRATMETLLGTPAREPESIAALGQWLAEADVAIVVLPAGVDYLTGRGKAAVDEQAASLDEQYGDPALADMLKDMKQGLEINRSILGFVDAEIAAGAVGVAIDETGNVRISDRFLFTEGGRLARLQNVPKGDEPALAGFPNEPFVFAGGGPIPPAWMEAGARLMRRIIEDHPEIYGFAGFDEAQWAEVEASWTEAMRARAWSMVMFAGAKDDPLYSNLYGRALVDDSTAYLASIKKSMATWNKLTAASTSDITLNSETSDVEIAGKRGVMVVTDVAAAAGDDDVPMIKPMFEAMFGGDGKIRFYSIAAAPQVALTAIAPEPKVTEALGWAADERGLANASEVAETAGLLNPAAPWTFYLSPQGIVIWAERMYTKVFSAFGGPAFPIPPYPAGPPLGMSMNLANGQFQGELVVPRKMLEGLADYIKQVMK
ncbi:MAG TPA: hypothetical protein VEQ85_11040 [Lacipirellulaceae bacterium]|nr:hypothetical protein [Lacipirellulaceae bacterium]